MHCVLAKWICLQRWRLCFECVCIVSNRCYSAIRATCDWYFRRRAFISRPPMFNQLSLPSARQRRRGYILCITAVPLRELSITKTSICITNGELHAALRVWGGGVWFMERHSYVRPCRPSPRRDIFSDGDGRYMRCSFAGKIGLRWPGGGLSYPEMCSHALT